MEGYQCQKSTLCNKRSNKKECGINQKESRYATGSTFVTMVTDHVTSKYRLSRDFLFTFVLVWNLILASFVSDRSNEQRDSLVVVIVMLELGMI